jgi:Family of unknown function (DUF6212)
MSARKLVFEHEKPLLCPVITDPLSSSTVYDGELKVIFADIDFPTIDGTCQLPTSFVRFVCSRQRDGSFELFKAGGKHGTVRIPLHHPPTFCLALLATSLAGKRELEGLRAAWSGAEEGFLPNPIFVDPALGGTAAALMAHRALLDAVVNTAASSAARLLLLQRQYTAFRMIHEQLQSAFDTVENFLSRANLPSTWLAFACEPAEAFIEPQSTKKPFRVTQLLPLPSQGLAAVELHAVRSAPDAQGLLAISVRTCEDERILASWQIPYDAVPDGWMFLDLPEIDIAPKQSASLTAIWDTRSGQPPKLSLTHLQPVPENRVRVTGDETSPRSLALRLHVGLPGSRRVAHPFEIGVLSQPPVSRLGRRLASSVLRRFAEVDAVPNGKPLVTFLEEEAALEVRPVNGTITVAKLPGALPPQARRVTATIKTEDPTGPLVEYALLALDPNDSHEAILNRTATDCELGGFSGWLPIHPDFTSQIHVNLAKPAIKSLDLYLATRIAKGQTAESAPARWLEFVIDALHETLTYDRTS